MNIELSDNRIEKLVKELSEGRLAPWKVEDVLENEGINRFALAAQTRRLYLERQTGMTFRHLSMLEKPYRISALCPACLIQYDIVANDTEWNCGICSAELKREKNPKPLVSSYIGGAEDFYSFAGVLVIHGDVNKTFYNILQYGTGLGPIGAARGCLYVYKLGGVEVVVAQKSRALRALCFEYETEEQRDRAWKVLMQSYNILEQEINDMLNPWQGTLELIEPMSISEGRCWRLYITFMGSFEHHRGHHAISKAVGAVKGKADAILAQRGCKPRYSFIAQGYDGDLKPSHRNFRGRYALAIIQAPLKKIEEVCRIDAEKLLRFIRIDSQGVYKLGYLGHTGMGGEILQGCYKATKVNPHSPLVSSTQNIKADIRNGNFIFQVEMPNIEAGVLSTPEGLIPPIGREILSFIGIRNSRDYAAWCCGLILAAEFNLCIEIAREKLYQK
mgnify:CR=1 FL=1